MGPEGASTTAPKVERRESTTEGAVSATPAPSPSAMTSAPTSVADVMALQHSVGNQQTAQLLAETPGSAEGSAAPEPVAVSATHGEVVQRTVDAPPVPLAVPAVDPADQATMDNIVARWGGVEHVVSEIERVGAEIFAEAVSAAAGDKKQTKKVIKAHAQYQSNLDETIKALGQVMLQAVTCQVELERGNAAAAAAIPSHDAALRESLDQLLRALMDVAKLAHSFGDGERAAYFTGLADDVQAEGGQLDHGDRGKKDKVDVKATAATVTTVADTANNAGPGVVGGAEAISGATIFGAVAGGIFGGLGIAFGAIGVGLGVKASIRGAQSEAELRALQPTLGSEDLAEATGYAAEKKRKKKEGGKAVAIGGATAIGAGIAGLVALSVTTLGIGAAILGVGAAVIGLSFLIGRWIHKSSKRDKYARTIADALVAAAKDDSKPEDQATARGELSKRGYDLAELGGEDEKSQTAALVVTLKQEGINRRDQMAATVYDALVGDSVSEQIDAERLVEALHLDPATLRELSADKAKSKIAGKMSSW